MNEQRFIWKCDDETCYIFDTVTKARYFYDGIMNLLNDQQKEIQRLEKIIDLTTHQLKVQDRILKELGE